MILLNQRTFYGKYHELYGSFKFLNQVADYWDHNFSVYSICVLLFVVENTSIEHPWYGLTADKITIHFFILSLCICAEVKTSLYSCQIYREFPCLDFRIPPITLSFHILYRIEHLHDCDPRISSPANRSYRAFLLIHLMLLINGYLFNISQDWTFYYASVHILNRTCCVFGI